MNVAPTATAATRLGADLRCGSHATPSTRLNPGGRLLLYTASAIVEGVDGFRSAVMSSLKSRDARSVYDEIDPDVFGEELDRPRYRNVDRIAVVGVTADQEEVSMTVHPLRFDKGATLDEAGDPPALHLALAEAGRRRLAPARPETDWRDEIVGRPENGWSKAPSWNANVGRASVAYQACRPKRGIPRLV